MTYRENLWRVNKHCDSPIHDFHIIMYDFENGRIKFILNRSKFSILVKKKNFFVEDNHYLKRGS